MTTPTADGFKRLMTWFDEDQLTAQDKLDQVQRKLASFFRERGVTAIHIDDLVQECVMITASKCNDALPPYPGPEPLMKGIARKLRLRYFREQGARREVIHEDGFLEQLATTVPAESPRAECLEAILASMEPDEYTILTAYYDSKRGRADLSRTLGLSSGALRVRVFRLKQRLSQRLRECIQPLPR